jgi:DeoR/GlpR family transcriptional regulator of sugar metabolism
MATKKVKEEITIERAPRAAPEGFVGINELATELGISPATLRRKLRGVEGLVKPEGSFGWSWKEGSKELTSLRKKLTVA